MNKHFVENAVFIFEYCLFEKNKQVLCHDSHAYFIEYILRRILSPMKLFFQYLLRFQALNATEV